MLQFSRMRLAAGNICLVLFIAFLFTTLSPMISLGNAEAVNASLTPGGTGTQENPTTFTKNANGQYEIIINIALTTPLTPDDFNNMFVDFVFGKVYLKDMNPEIVNTVYEDEVSGKVYKAVYSLAYLVPETQQFSYNEVITAWIYSAGDGPLPIYLKSIYRPPSGGGGGGGYPIIFRDIINHWAQADIELMAAKNIAKGVTVDLFAPDATITRAQFAAFLQRALGLKVITPAKATFKDVKATSWYYGMIEGAAAAGLVHGYGDGTFKPEGLITRQEMAIMVANALKYGGKKVTLSTAEINANLVHFADAKEIAAWAREAAAIAAKEGIVKGRTATQYAPTANATRAEGVVMIKRILTSLGKI